MRIGHLLLASLMLASPVAAQETTRPAESPEIIVEGTRDRDRQIREFVGALTDAPVRGQLSRFDYWAVCPAVAGLPEQQNKAIQRRMRQVAAAAGMKVAAEACRPNALVIAAPDRHELIAELRRNYPGFFTNVPDHRLKAQAKHGHATAWHVEGLLDANGIPASWDHINKRYVVESTEPTRLRAASRPHFVASIVVVDLKALAALTTTQFADYAAMRAYAQVDPLRLRPSTAPTILHVLDAPMGTPTPVTLTDWDLGFLRALYSSEENKFAHQQRNEIQQILRKELEEAKQEPEE